MDVAVGLRRLVALVSATYLRPPALWPYIFGPLQGLSLSWRGQCRDQKNLARVWTPRPPFSSLPLPSCFPQASSVHKVSSVVLPRDDETVPLPWGEESDYKFTILLSSS